MTETANKIDWSKYMAAHGAADVQLEVEPDEDNRPFLKKMFSGAPPKKKIGNVEELLGELKSDDAKKAGYAFEHVSHTICRNEFVAQAALPAFPLLLEALEDAASKDRAKLANLILELLKGFAINLHRQALYPKGVWAAELEGKMKAALPEIRNYSEKDKLKESVAELVAILEREPAKIFELKDEIDWLEDGEMRFINSELEEELTKKLDDLGFKVYKVDCENIEVEMEIVNSIVAYLELTEEDLGPTEYWGWAQFIDTMHNDFDGGGSDHVAILCTNLSPGLNSMKETVMQEVENIVVAVQGRDKTILHGPVQKEFFFLCDEAELRDIPDEPAEEKCKVVCLDPENVEFHKHNALKAVDNEQFEEAVNHYSKCIDLTPDDFSFYRQRAQVYRIIEEFEKAVNDCTKAIELDENSMTHCERARSHLGLKNYQEAIDDCKKELEHSEQDDIESWVPYYLIAKAHIGMEKFEEALENCEKSLTLQVNKEGYETRALIHKKLGQDDMHEEDKQKADSAPDGDPGVL